MLTIVAISGCLLALVGVSLYRNRRKVLGAIFAVAGAILALLSVIGVTTFHP
jgi:hypothetical protein